MSVKKYYVVWIGKQTGIFATWDECKAQTDGYANARYKSFSTLADAQEALHTGITAAIFRKPAPATPAASNSPFIQTSRPLLPSLSVDAACSGNPGPMEYRGVDTASGKQLFHYGPAAQGTNNIGEFLAIVHGLAYLKQHNCNDVPIYSDSRNALKWVREKKVRTTLERNNKTEKLFQLIDRAIAWLQQNNYANALLKWDTERWGECPADFGRK